MMTFTWTTVPLLVLLLGGPLGPADGWNIGGHSPVVDHADKRLVAAATFALTALQGLAAGAAGTTTAAMTGASFSSRRKRRRASVAEMGTAVGARRVNVHATQPMLWEPGVT